MSSFDKTVKLACKPKAAPPKAKYIDPIIAATYSEDGAVHDVCKALAPRLREPNSIVVFKALIVLHTMIRNGATDNVLTYLSSEDVLKLKSVSTGHWEGYDTPRNLQNYAIYLDTRIRTYRDLKHDPVRVQTDSNRDLRVESSIEASTPTIFRSSNGLQRSKTNMGRKLRSMTVEKGLLRETKAVQRTINALVECRFYFDNLEDDLNVTALRMLVKDLCILFQALNEGVINVLEHYFEMSHVDAETALTIYRNFCKQTEKVVEYLGVARKLQNLLNVPIPNLKHAPVSLVTALEEYLNDPNFEQNRIEYKTTKALADKNAKEGIKAPLKGKDKPSSSNTDTSSKPGADSSSANPPPKESNQALVDFFSSIEEEQTVMFAAQSNNQLLQQQQAPHNPFVQRQSMVMTGAFSQNQQPFMQPAVQIPQPTGFIQPQHTAFTGASFQLQPQQNTHPQSHPAFASFLHPQQPQFTGFLQPQATGANPFRQSLVMPQMTGMHIFGSGVTTGSNPNASGVSFSVQPSSDQSQTSFAPKPTLNAMSSPPSTFNGATNQSLPQRPASTPLASAANSFGVAKPVVSHQTGSRNPFGIPQESPPPVPKLPTLQELSTGASSKGAGDFGQQRTTPGSLISSSNSTDGSNMSNIASSFSLDNDWSMNSKKPGNDTTEAPSLASQFTSTTTFSSQLTGATNAASAPSFTSPLQPQTTGFSGLKPFKPTSSFGASLLESLPPIPQSDVPTPSASDAPSTQPRGAGPGAVSQTTLPPSNGLSTSGLGSTSSNSTTAPSLRGFSTTATGLHSSGLGALNTQPTGVSNFPPFGSGRSAFGSSMGVGLRPQMTGGGIANPFRASMLAGSAPAGSFPPSQFGLGLGTNATGAPSFGASLLQSKPGDASKQQNSVASLI